MAETYKGIRVSATHATVQDLYGYPENCYVEVINYATQAKATPNVSRHEICYHGAPSTLFANAPIGSILIDTSTASIHIKTAAAGTSTWVSATFS